MFPPPGHGAFFNPTEESIFGPTTPVVSIIRPRPLAVRIGDTRSQLRRGSLIAKSRTAQKANGDG